MTYGQALDVIRSHAGDIIPSTDMRRVLGNSLHDLLHKHGLSAQQGRRTPKWTFFKALLVSCLRSS